MQGRKANPVQQPVDVSFKDEAFDRLNDGGAELVALQTQQQQAARAVALQLGYQLPADSADPDLIQRDIAANMRRSVEACLEVGRGLRVLKEACGHGNFVARLDVLGIEYTVATRFMQAATKFSKVATSQLLKVAGTQSKLFEMLVLDDEQIEELELTGQTGELRLDDVATMSVKELRAALREARAEAEATGQLLADKNKALDKAKAAARRLASAPREDVMAQELAEVTSRFHTALAYVRGDLRLGFQKLFDREADGSAEPGSHRQVMAGYVKEIEHEIAVLKSDFFLFDVPAAATESVA